ncbi:hypothetical protein NAPIS_ORF02610 [Vairimorpha apis BRL 01]|uniref:Uncharacterized protein n=1 Tax=Vairimorpha apis BRL 01 TaxID=1037528 RepID=T0L5N9_9MICR|nr:hypothetical protein NAPIS_ORF02610 [Vairimorpha apis BRL 01]
MFGKRVCKNKKIVSVCDDNGVDNSLGNRSGSRSGRFGRSNRLGSRLGSSLWKIVPKVFGFTIQIDNKCITKGEDDKVVLSSCTESDDQLFNFKKVCEDCSVKDEDEKHSVHINILPDNVSRFTVTDHDKLSGNMMGIDTRLGIDNRLGIDID